MVPEKGHFHGWEIPIKMMYNKLKDTFEEALQKKSAETKKLVKDIVAKHSSI